MKNQNPENKIYEIASKQGGYFTAWQAKKAGFIETNHPYHVQKGNWIREWRGIYRLVRYPIQDDSQFALWSIWAMNRKGEMQGIYSHETALALFDLSDAMPEKLNITVPRSFRRHSQIPQILHIHFGENNPGDFEERQGYRVTKPFKTVIDLIRIRSTSPEIINQAIKQALDKGYITRSQIPQLMEMPRIGFKIKEIMGESA